MAWMTDLIRTSRPTCERNFSFHPCNHLHTLSLMSLKVFFLALPIIDGKPKYYSNWVVGVAPNICKTASHQDWWVLWLKNNVVFPPFTFYPEAFSYKERTIKTASHSDVVALQNIILSSAKNKCDTRGPPQQIETPWIRLSLSAFLSNADKPSTQIRKKVWRKRITLTKSPCRFDKTCYPNINLRGGVI